MSEKNIILAIHPFREGQRANLDSALSNIDKIKKGVKVRIKEDYDGDDTVYEVESIPSRGQVKLKGRKLTVSPAALEIVEDEE